MKSWLRTDRVYHSIMNSALWIVFLAALCTTQWPQTTWIALVITIIVSSVVAFVYWFAVVCNEDETKHEVRESVDITQIEVHEQQTNHTPTYTIQAYKNVSKLYQEHAKKVDIDALGTGLWEPRASSLTKSRIRSRKLADWVEAEEDDVNSFVVRVGSLTFKIEDDYEQMDFASKSQQVSRGNTIH